MRAVARIINVRPGTTMPLKGEAKARYQREYMRRRRTAERAGRPEKPPQSDEPTSSEISEITYLARRPPWRNRRGTPKAWVINGLFEAPARNDGDFLEALRRLRAIKAEQRKKRRERRANRKKPPRLPSEPMLPFCDVCGEEKRETTVVRYSTICRDCAAQAIEQLEAATHAIPASELSTELEVQPPPLPHSLGPGPQPG